MPHDVQTEKTKRKAPTQERSKATVEAILEATARILVEDGLDRFTTNRAAKVAGVSVGSLYQYFPNKESIICALCDRHIDDMMDLLQRCLADFAGAPVEDAVRMFTRGMLQAHALEPKLHHAVMLTAAQYGIATQDNVEARMSQSVRLWLEMHRADIRPKDLDLATFVLIRSVESVMHTGLLGILPMTRKNAREQKIAALEEEVNALVLGYLGIASADAA